MRGVIGRRDGAAERTSAVIYGGVMRNINELVVGSPAWCRPTLTRVDGCVCFRSQVDCLLPSSMLVSAVIYWIWP